MQIGQVLQAQIMPGVQAQAKLFRHIGRFHERCHSTLTISGITCCIRLSVKFHAVSTTSSRSFNHGGVCRNKDRSPDSRCSHFGHNGFQKSCMRHRIPPMIGGQLFRGVWHQGHLGRPHCQHQLAESLVGISLDVKLRAQRWFQRKNVRTPDMSLIRTRMYCDALRTERFTIERHCQHIRIVPSSCISQRGDFIYIHAKFCHCLLCFIGSLSPFN